MGVVRIRFGQMARRRARVGWGEGWHGMRTGRTGRRSPSTRARRRGVLGVGTRVDRLRHTYRDRE